MEAVQRPLERGRLGPPGGSMRDVSCLVHRQVKAYCERQFNKILSGRVSIADFVFAKEVRWWGWLGRAHGGLPESPHPAHTGLWQQVLHAGECG